MELTDILSIVSSRIYHMEEYSPPKSFKYQLMAKKYGGIACYSPEEQADGILIVFVINVLDQMQTDAKTYVDSLVDIEQFDIVDLLEKNIYKLTYIFFTPEDEGELENVIININCSEPIIDYEDGESEEYYEGLAKEGLDLLVKDARVKLTVIK